MTTEERALEISESFYRPETGYNDEHLYMSAMAMAEWKTQQMCEWLEKHITNYINWEYNEFHQCVEYDGSYDIEKMISDVRKAMEE